MIVIPILKPYMNSKLYKTNKLDDTKNHSMSCKQEKSSIQNFYFHC